ncbi:helix-turn-helix domain-containing protein [Priestia aryabhattai]|uniref:helix-turn-helix domain-containing protein n=1 Tax=Priestia aryabhattai TaxID=412384 RepID=UPI001C8EE2D2|nr:helix-turn-helix transcriptional regulator [Priestia aryabhattai]MBX9996060.1 helix-turn-helix transcriptional regulator [Priestia aryabhattai]
MYTEKVFGEILKKIRKKQKMSQEQLALACNLERTYISMLERGTRNPTLNTIFKLSTVLGVKPSHLINMVEESLDKTDNYYSE